MRRRPYQPPATVSPEQSERSVPIGPIRLRTVLWWVISAAKDDTRVRRIGAIVAKAAKGERAEG